MAHFSLFSSFYFVRRRPLKYREPDRIFERVTELTPEYLRAQGVRALILDVDNTLTLPEQQSIAPEIKVWLNDMKSHNIGLAIVSNNSRERIEPFARKIGVMYIAKARKPFPGGYRKAVSLMGVSPEQTAVVGDQIYTDILGARLSGLKAWLVKPFVLETAAFFRLKRKLEQRPIANYRRRQEENSHV